MGAKTEFVCRCCGKKSAFNEADLDCNTDATPDIIQFILDAPLVDIYRYGRARVEAGEHKFYSTTDEIDAEYERMCAKGADVQYAFAPRQFDDVCGGCRNRGELCQHNFNDHQSMGAHSSRPHPDDAGAQDPSTCPYCRNTDGVQKGIPRVTNKEER